MRVWRDSRARAGRLTAPRSRSPCLALLPTVASPLSWRERLPVKTGFPGEKNTTILPVSASGRGGGSDPGRRGEEEQNSDQLPVTADT